jgi:type IV pilus assembly protein PilC
MDIEVGMQQLASMLHNGLSLLSALRTVAEQARRPSAAALWRQVAEAIERGSSFSGALEAQRRRFPDYVIQLIRVGENSGELDAMLTRAAEHLEQSRNLRTMVVNALAYPMIVAVLAVGVSSYMLLAVIPKIQRFLAASGHGLPPLTQALVDVSTWVRHWLPGIGLGLAAAVATLWTVRRWPPGRTALDAACLRIPVVGSVLRLADTATFARAMGILLESGVALLDSLRTVEPLLRNRAMGCRVAEARLAVTRGETMANALAGRREFLPMLPRMIAVGEASGTLGRTLSDVARFHEVQLLTAIRRMSVLIEPVLILVVGGMVGFVYIAFFVALFSLATGVR